MTEEKIEEKVEETVDPYAEVAKEFGWNPDYEGDDAVDAKTFVINTKGINDSLKRTVKSLKKDMGALREGIDVVKWSVEQSSKREIDRLKAEISDLKAKKKEAIEERDVAAVERIDNQIGELTENVKEQKQPAQDIPDEFKAWVKKNKWYDDDEELRIYADTLGADPTFKAMAVGNYPRFLDTVAQNVKKVYPDKFTEKKKVSPVTPTKQRGAPPRQKVTADDLDYTQRRIGTDFVHQGLFKTLDEYAQSLAEQQEEKKK